MTLNLNPDVEARLRALARRNGISVEAFLQHIVEEKSRPAPREQQLSPEEWASQFEQWANSFPDTPPIPDEALSRENLYPDR